MTEPRPGRWTSPPRNRRRSLGVLRSIYHLFFLAFVFVSVIRWDHSEVVLGIGAAVFVVWMVAAVALFAREIVRMRRTRHDRALAGDPDGVEEFAVEIVVTARGTVTGMDRGVVWFDGPLFGFSGRHTSFLLAATDMVAPQGVILTDRDRPYLPIQLNAGKEKVGVQVRPLFGFGTAYRRRMLQFLRADESSDAERQWPPLSPYEETPERKALA